MRIGTTLSSRGHGRAAMAFAGLAALSAACASGGGARPLTGVEAEALFAGLTGAWDVDESTGTQAPNFQFTDQPEVHSDVKDLGQARQMAERMAAEGLQRLMADLRDLRPILEVWLDRPSTLILRVDEDRLVYVPTPGRRVEMPMSGEWISWQDQEGESVRARVYWRGDKLSLEHRAGSGGRVRSVLEIVDGRLRSSRTLQLPRMSGPTRPYVLMYDPDEGGSGERRS